MAVSAGWGFVGAESRWIPGLTAMLFALGTVVLLTSALAEGQGLPFQVPLRSKDRRMRVDKGLVLSP